MEKEKKEEKERSRLILRILITILVIHLFLMLSRCTITKEVKVGKEVPTTVTKVHQDAQTECTENEFNWKYAWEGWQPPIENKIAPKFRLINYQDRTGQFVVSFAFFDNAKFKFEDYQGKNYNEVRDNLPWDEADMHVAGYTVVLEPFGEIVIAPSVRKIDPNAEYWAYADISVPNYTECHAVVNVSYLNVTVMVNKTEMKNVTETRSLWEIFTSWIFGKK